MIGANGQGISAKKSVAQVVVYPAEHVASYVFDLKPGCIAFQCRLNVIEPKARLL